MIVASVVGLVVLILSTTWAGWALGRAAALGDRLTTSGAAGEHSGASRRRVDA